MANEKVTWRKKLYNRTPFYVTLTGYIFGLSILFGAASTWFIESDIYAQGQAMLKPARTNVSYPEESVLVEWLMKPGDRVEKDQVVAKVITEPVAVANYKMRHHLVTAIQDLESHDNAKANGQLTQLREVLAGVPEDAKPAVSSAPVSGWLEDVPQDENGGSRPRGLMPPKAPLFSVAGLREVTLEMNVATKLAPNLTVGDEISLLLAEWDKNYLQGTVSSIKSTLSAQIPLTKFDAKELSVLKVESDSVEIYGRVVPCAYTVLEEVVKIGLDAGQISGEDLERVNGGGTLRLAIPALNDKQLKTKWDMVSSSLSVVIPEESISPPIRKNLEEQLKDGISAIPVSRCWVEVGRQKLFRRLFSK
jgi:hypothetical protein